MKRAITIIMAILMLTIIMAILVLATSCFALSRWRKLAEFEDEYFKYRAINSNEVLVYGFTELGAQQKVLIVPHMVNGYHVTEIGGLVKYTWSVQHIEAPLLQKIYIPKSVTDVSGALRVSQLFCAAFFIETWTYNSASIRNFSWPGAIAIAELLKTSNVDNTRIANIEFLLNCNEGLADVFWLDIEPAESLITKWYEGYYTPEREGYTFIGWYKEPECINEWNFMTDKTPTEVLDETTGEPITQITRLYAKWEQN